MDDNFFDGFCWHSSIGIDTALDGGKKFVTRIKNTTAARSMFISGGGGTLIHKTTKCLWRISDDKKSIEPVFSSDVMTDKEVEEAMSEDK